MNLNPSPSTCDVAIVGGGIAGLAAAIEAAGAGRGVTLFDARSTLGGRARTHTRDGYLLNEGAHALYVDGAANAFLRELGCEPAGVTPDAGRGIGVDGSLEGRFPTTPWALLRTPLLRGDRLAMGKLFARLGKLDPADFADRTVEQAVHDLLGTGRAARLGAALFRLSTYSNSPATTSADAGIRQLQMSVDGGVRYLHGGWQTIVNSLAHVARTRGVDIRTGVKVTEVAPTDDGRHHLRTTTSTTTNESDDDDTNGNTTSITADNVVVAGTPQLAATLLGDSAPVTRQWAADATPAAVACLDVGVSDDWRGHVPFALGIDTPTYLSVHAPVADLAPSGHSLIHVMHYLPASDTPDADRSRAMCDALLDRVRPNWRQVADHVSFRPHLVAASDQPRATSNGLAGRPPVTVPDAHGLFVAGDWVGPEGSLVDAPIASGRAAGRAAAQHARAPAAAGSRS